MHWEAVTWKYSCFFQFLQTMDLLEVISIECEVGALLNKFFL